MPTCIYCRCNFASAGGEHILQNSLGARWTSPTIVCGNDQKHFGGTIDLDLSNQLKTFRSLFDHETGRGNPAPTLKDLPTLRGNRVALEPGGVLQLNQPEVTVKPHTANSKAVEISMRDDRDIGWALHLLKQQVPNAQIDESLIRRLAVRATKGVEEVVNLQLQFGGPRYHRAGVKSVFNLAAACGAPAHDPCFDAVRGFVREGRGDSDQFIRFAVKHNFVPATKLSPVDHFIAVVSRGNLVQGFLQYYGALQHVLQLATDYHGPAFCFGYVVNPLRDTNPAETRSPVFDPDRLPKFLDQPALPTEATMAWMRARLGPVIEFHLNAGRKKRIAQIVDEVLGPHAGKAFTPDLMRKLAGRIAFEVRGIARPADGPATASGNTPRS